jgi:transposase InsO family protein
MARLLGVSRSGYYAWEQGQTCPSGKRKEENALIDKELEDICQSESRGNYGSRRYRDTLRSRGFKVGRGRVRRRMRQLQIVPKKRRRFKATTNSKHDLPIAPNLLNREFCVSAPNRAWVGDITYVAIGDGWGYLATVIDLYSRKIVGWAFSTRITADLVVRAFLMAVWNRWPSDGLIFHSDRGSQYASEAFRAVLKQWRCSQSMSRKGNCWDNAVAESFFRSIKVECLYHEKFSDPRMAELKVFEYIAWYNRIRVHSACGGVSPDKYENAMLLCA